VEAEEGREKSVQSPEVKKRENSCDVAEYRDISTLRIIVAERVVHSNVQQVLREQLLCS